jgi:RHS repeat-associated protein
MACCSVPPIDPLGHTTANTYNTSHNLLTVTDPLKHTITYTYDSNGNRTSVKRPGLAASQTVYNAHGERTQTIDELGNVRNFSYDSNFWPKLISDSIGPVVSFTFNANGTVASNLVGYDLTAAPGKATTYTYDAYGNMTSATDPLGRQTTYTYDTLGRLQTRTAPAGGTTTNTYDLAGNLLSVAAPLSRTSSYTYDLNGNKLSMTDPDNHTTSYQYDSLNRLTQVTYPDNTKTTYTYDFRSNPINITDQADRATHKVYDVSGRLTSVTAAFGKPEAATTSYTYYDDGRKATQTDPLGRTMTYNYDPAGRLTSTVDAQNQTTTYTYDDAGNRTSLTDANLHKTQSQYDARRRLQKTTYNDNTTRQYTHDGYGHVTSVIDQAGNTVQHTYDAANQLASVIQSPSQSFTTTTAYSYDANGNLNALTDANSHTTLNGFDVLNQLKQETMPAGQTQTRSYDATGNLISLTDYNGKTTTYTYDALNRLLSRIPDPSLPDVPETFTYTPTGKRATMTDASGTTTYTYDNLDRLITKATPQGTLTYMYDRAGNVASMQSSNPHGVSAAYTYDNLNRLATVVDNNLPTGQNTTTYTYDPVSNLATATYPNGLQSTFVYDDLNRLRSLNGYQYQLGPTGNRTGATEPSGRTLTWSYDGIYRLTQEAISLDPHSNNGTVNYGLDPVGNRLSQSSSIPLIGSGTFTFDPDDRLSTETYDNNGNTIVSGARNFAYDFRNRLVNMNSGAVRLIYDGDGNRVAKTTTSFTTRYLVDDLNPTGYAQVVEELVGGAVQRSYTYGLQRLDQNQLINGTWTPSFYGYDGFGSVRQLTGTTGTVTDTYDYDAWGNTANTTGSTPNIYLFRGEQYDPDLQLYYLRARYFNPLTGRFISRDPIRPRNQCDEHRYLYACSDPVNRIDPSGLGSIDRTLLSRFLVIGGLGAGAAEEAGESVAALEDYGVNALMRAINLTEGLASRLGTWTYWRITVAVADVADTKLGAVTRYIAVSTERAAEAIGEEAAASQELQLLKGNFEEILRESEKPFERFVGWVENEHAEEQLVRATFDYLYKWALAAGRAICPDRCLQVVEGSGFKVFGPVDGNPIQH